MDIVLSCIDYSVVVGLSDLGSRHISNFVIPGDGGGQE